MRRDRSKSQASFGFKLDQRLRQEKITKDELWDQMENADPISNKQYVNWLIKAFQEGSKVEDLTSRGADNLIKFELLKKKKLLKLEHTDISRFRTLTDLEDVLEQYELPEKELTNRGKYEEVFKTNTIRIIEVFDQAAARYYGQGTRWCTAVNTNNQFDYYIEQGPIFIILPLKPTYIGEKYQFWYNNKNFEKYDFRDEKDIRIIYRELKLKFSDIIKIFNDLILEKVPENKWYKFIEFINNPSEEMQLSAVLREGNLMKYIDNPSEKVQIAAVSQKGCVILYIINQTEKIQLAAISQNSYSILHISNPTKSVQFAAISQNGLVIKYIKNPSEDMKLAAVSQDGYAIKYIENPSEDVQLTAIKQNKDYIKFINNPTEKVKRYINICNKYANQ